MFLPWLKGFGKGGLLRLPMSDRRAGSPDRSARYYGDAPPSGRRAGSHDPYAGWYDTYDAGGGLPRRAADAWSRVRHRRSPASSRDEVPVGYTPTLDVGHWVPVSEVVDTKHKASFSPIHSRRIRAALKELEAGRIAEQFSL